MKANFKLFVIALSFIWMQHALYSQKLNKEVFYLGLLHDHFVGLPLSLDDHNNLCFIQKDRKVNGYHTWYLKHVLKISDLYVIQNDTTLYLNGSEQLKSKQLNDLFAKYFIVDTIVQNGVLKRFDCLGYLKAMHAKEELDSIDMAEFFMYWPRLLINDKQIMRRQDQLSFIAANILMYGGQADGQYYIKRNHSWIVMKLCKNLLDTLKYDYTNDRLPKFCLHEDLKFKLTSNQQKELEKYIRRGRRLLAKQKHY